MKVETLVLGVLLLPACGSGDDSTGTGSSDASSSDGSHPEAAAAETSTGDAANADAASDASDAEASTGPTDAAVDAGDAGPDAGPDAGGAESGDGACPGDWLDTTGLYSGVVPEAGVAILHAAGAGTQNYACETGALTDGGPTYTWTFVGPEATLDDCHATLIGHHFASDAGAAAPEWQTL